MNEKSVIRKWRDRTNERKKEINRHKNKQINYRSYQSNTIFFSEHDTHHFKFEENWGNEAERTEKIEFEGEGCKAV